MPYSSTERIEGDDENRYHCKTSVQQDISKSNNIKPWRNWTAEKRTRLMDCVEYWSLCDRNQKELKGEKC